jgi:hypothetical protein
MRTDELRDPELARRFLVQGLWLQRVLTPVAETVRPVLEWVLEVVAAGEPLPPAGFLADLGHLAFGNDPSVRPSVPLPTLPDGLARRYEDYVLGKLYADYTFDRAAGALRRYQGRDRARGLAFVVRQVRERIGLGGVHLSPGMVKDALQARPEQVLADGWESLQRDGVMPLLPPLYEALITAFRHAAELLGPEDLFELERGTALAELGQRVGLRQVLQAATRLGADLPARPRRPPGRRHEVPTHLLAEDVYPVGGFASLSNRGSLESLLHSQLAYMEKADRPDLFDIKFVRGELLYYARDENQFLRQRRTFIFALCPDLVEARFKDAALPFQRIVLLLGLLVLAVRKLSEWLSTDALHFEFVFVEADEPGLLAEEQTLVETLLADQVANGTVRVERLTGEQLLARCVEQGRRSRCHCVLASTVERGLPAEAGDVMPFVLSDPAPALPTEPEEATEEEPLAAWCRVAERLLARWA